MSNNIYKVQLTNDSNL